MSCIALIFPGSVSSYTVKSFILKKLNLKIKHSFDVCFQLSNVTWITQSLLLTKSKLFTFFQLSEHIDSTEQNPSFLSFPVRHQLVLQSHTG